MKKKYILTIFSSTLLLCSCGGNSTQSSSNKLSSTSILSSSSIISSSSTTSTKSSISTSSSVSTSTSSSSKPTGPNYEVPTSNYEIIELLENTSYVLAKNHETSYTYSRTSYPQKYDFEDYGYMNTERVISHRYTDHTSKEITIEKSKSTNSIDYTNIYSFNGLMYIGNFENKNIHLEKYDTSNVPSNEYISKTNNLSLLEVEEGKELNDYLVSDLYQKVNGWIETFGTKYLDKKINNDGSVTFSKTNEIIEEQVSKVEIDLIIELDANGFVTYAKYINKTYSYDWNLNDFKTNTTEHTIDEYTCVYDEKLNGNDDFTLINPNEYILTDAVIGFIENNSYSQVLLDNNNIKVGTSIKPFIVSATPSTALDKSFVIVSSSNPDIVVENYGVWKCIMPGTTTLTLVNELGLEKQVDITVYTPSLTSITLSLSNQNMLVNNSYQLYVYGTPYDAVSTFNFYSSDTEIADVIYEDGKYMINCKKAGNCTITVTSIEFPLISNSIDIKVSDDASDQSYAAILTANTWYVYSYNTYTQLYLAFYEDGRGILYDDYGESSSFKWTIDGTKVTISEIFFYYNYEYTTFIENTINISTDGSRLYANFSDGFYTVMIETFSKYY